MSETDSKQARDRGNGKYIHTMDALCTCGHELGLHTAEAFEGQRPCLAGDFGHEPCECESFKKAKRGKV